MFIGEICSNGKSLSAFLTDDNCSFDVCDWISPRLCGLIARQSRDKTGYRISLSKVFSGLIPLSPAISSFIAGAWRAEATLRQGERIVARVRARESDSNEWSSIYVGVEENVREFYTSSESTFDFKLLNDLFRDEDSEREEL